MRKLIEKPHVDCRVEWLLHGCWMMLNVSWASRIRVRTCLSTWRPRVQTQARAFWIYCFHSYANCAFRIRIPNPILLICVLGMAQLCELRTSDTYSASNVASLLAWRSAAMRITHFGHPSRKAAGEARTENILHRSTHRIVDVRRDT